MKIKLIQIIYKVSDSLSTFLDSNSLKKNKLLVPIKLSSENPHNETYFGEKLQTLLNTQKSNIVYSEETTKHDKTIKTNSFEKLSYPRENKAVKKPFKLKKSNNNINNHNKKLKKLKSSLQLCQSILNKSFYKCSSLPKIAWYVIYI